MSLSSPIPTRLGRYEIIGLLATGGMAEVHLARFMGPSGFERVVVIKRILPHLARERAFVDMFLDEARIVAKINHPNVIQVTELGRDADELFLVMEFVEGESLGGFMRRNWANGREIGTGLAAFIVAEMCSGLHAAHELKDEDGRAQEVVHRDVSPQNVMITYGGRVKVLDFGIAKAVDRSTQTRTGHLKGKVEYMSPEQCRSLPLDRRSDVFALGVILFELSTGKRLFRRRGELEALRAVCDEPIPLPTAVLGEYPPALEAICMRALSRNVNDRFASADEMRRALLSYLRSTPEVGLHDDALADRMKELFADRLELKNDMLRSVRSGSEISRLPAPEVDLGVEVPMVPTVVLTGVSLDAQPAHSTARSLDAAAPGRASRRLLSAVAIVGATAGIVTAGWFAIASRATAKPAGAAAAGPALVEAPALLQNPAAAASNAASAASVDVAITTTPPGARVLIAGHEEGVTPTHVSVPRGDGPIDVDIELDGFSAHAEHVVPNVDQRLSISLTPSPRSSQKRSPPSTASSAGRYRKFN